MFIWIPRVLMFTKLCEIKASYIQIKVLDGSLIQVLLFLTRIPIIPEKKILLSLKTINIPQLV